MLPEALLKLREELQGIVAQDLATDSQGILLAEIASRHLLGQHLGQAAAGQFGSSVDSFSSVGVGAQRMRLDGIISSHS